MDDHCKSDVCEAWSAASVDLSIEIITPFTLVENDHRYECIAYVPHFGSPNGTLVMSMDGCREIVKAGMARGYYVCMINADEYRHYERQHFIDVLNDWRYFGARSAFPQWYTGEPWTSP